MLFESDVRVRCRETGARKSEFKIVDAWRGLGDVPNLLRYHVGGGAYFLRFGGNRDG